MQFADLSCNFTGDPELVGVAIFAGAEQLVLEV
jgi:hypothetical protein